jgi:hypothetical protein
MIRIVSIRTWSAGSLFPSVSLWVILMPLSHRSRGKTAASVSFWGYFRE